MNQTNTDTQIKDKLKGYFTLSSLPFLFLAIYYFMKKEKRNNVESILLLFFVIIFIVNFISIINFLRKE